MYMARCTVYGRCVCLGVKYKKKKTLFKLSILGQSAT